ncbi:restriction endonuclease subunit S [Acetobacter oryzifermentans]|uniref:restriction endonuclease subunit S n=1 Tax=Acetobacter oryzifermentans TaxID=1633874 RepID=UPI0039BF7EC7
MSFPKYPAYKDSGVEWIGEIPEGWSVSSIKRCSYLKARVGWKGLTSDEFEENSYAYLVTGSDFKSSRIQWRQCYQVNKARYDDDPFIHLIEGDLLITKDGTVGKLALVEGLDKPACLNSGIFLLRPLHSYLTNFMEWVLRSKLFSHFVDLRSYGSTINHLYQNVFEEFSFPLPTFSEQKAIASFLECECAKIDALIAEQERLITLLQEKRQAVISHAVTKGLEPNVPMKESGIEWIKKIPSHWKTQQLKLFSQFVSGATPSKDNLDFWSGNIPWVSPKDMKTHYLLDTHDHISENALSHSATRLIQPDNILIVVRSGILQRTIPVAINTIPATINQDIKGIILNKKIILPDFLLFIIQGYTNFFLSVWSKQGATVESIEMKYLENTHVTLPPIAEQQNIISYLRNKCNTFNKLIKKTKKNTLLLKERRSALISAAVTGKIDVRTLVKPKDIAA